MGRERKQEFKLKQPEPGEVLTGLVVPLHVNESIVSGQLYVKPDGSPVIRQSGVFPTRDEEA